MKSSPHLAYCKYLRFAIYSAERAFIKLKIKLISKPRYVAVKAATGSNHEPNWAQFILGVFALHTPSISIEYTYKIGLIYT